MGGCERKEGWITIKQEENFDHVDGSWVYTYVKMHQIVYFKYMQFLISQIILQEIWGVLFVEIDKLILKFM